MEILNLIAGLIFIYFILSLICNAVFEAISTLYRKRSVLLEQWIKKTFDPVIQMDPGKKDSIVPIDPLPSLHFLNNPLIDGLTSAGKSPSYIKSKDFAGALIQLIIKETPMQADFGLTFETGLMALRERKRMPENTLDALSFLWQKAKLNMGRMENAQLEKEIQTLFENWFDSMMDRVGGRYRQGAMKWNFFIATIITLLLNVDSISLVKYLNANKEASAKLAEAAYKATSDTSFQKAVIRIQEQNVQADSVNYDEDDLQFTNEQLANVARADVSTQINRVNELTTQLGLYIPLGWGNGEFSVFRRKHYQNVKTIEPGQIIWFGLSKSPGWLLTIFALMLGAPFWYEVLNKVANIRNSIKPLTAAQEASKQLESGSKLLK